MAIEHSAHYERMSLEEYLTLVEQDPEHAYEYLDGRVYMMTGGSPEPERVQRALDLLERIHIWAVA